MDNNNKLTAVEYALNLFPMEDGNVEDDIAAYKRRIFLDGFRYAAKQTAEKDARIKELEDKCLGYKTLVQSVNNINKWEKLKPRIENAINEVRRLREELEAVKKERNDLKHSNVTALDEILTIERQRDEALQQVSVLTEKLKKYEQG